MRPKLAAAAAPLGAFDDSMRQNVLDRLQIETDLRTALAKGQFVVFYQPRVDLDT